MKTLEIVPLKGKVLNVTIVNKEYNQPFGISKPDDGNEQKGLSSIFRPSVAFCTALEKFIQFSPTHYITEEQGTRSTREFFQDNVIAKLCEKHGISFYVADIDENAKGYLDSSIEEKRILRDRMVTALKELPDTTERDDSTGIQKDYLVAYAQCLQDEIAEAEREIAFSVRESWIVMEILERAKNVEDEEVNCIHISSPAHVSGVKKLLESLDVNVSSIQFQKKLVLKTGKTDLENLSSLLESAQIQVKPIINKNVEELPYLLFFLDTDNRASPFDISMAYDAGFSAVIPYEDVTSEDVKRIVQDAIFSRDPKGIHRTCFFVGGKDMEKAEDILRVVCETMFPPFKTSVIVDPAGAYTTAAAMISKIEEGLLRSNLGELENKRCAIFGTGAVGRTAAILLTRLGCPTTISSLNPSRTDGQVYIELLAKLLMERRGTNVEGIYAPTSEERVKVIKRADVILCTAAAGVRVIDGEMLKQLRHVKVMADINAVRPLGVEGLKLDDDMREIATGIFGIGALTIGRMKYRLEQETLREARRTGDGVYNYNFALKLARQIQRSESFVKRIAVTLNYPKDRRTASVKGNI